MELQKCHNLWKHINCVARFNPFTIFSGYNLTNCKHCETYDTSENSKICENIGKSEPSETSEPEKIVKGVNLVKSKTSELVLNITKQNGISLSYAAVLRKADLKM